MRAKPVFSEEESRILVAIYMNPEISYDAYSLTTEFHPAIKITTPEYEIAFRNTMGAIEQLVVRGLVDGNQLKGGFGMYFNELKLRFQGKQAAIMERGRIAEFKNALPSAIEESNVVAEEMKRADERK